MLIIANGKKGAIKERRECPKGTRALGRDEAMQVYGNMQQKDQVRSGFNYERVEEVYSYLYAGLDPRRRVEMAEGGMIKEDKKAMANLPLEARHHEYLRAGYYSTPYIDDSREVEE